jgi:hypothetical protein
MAEQFVGYQGQCQRGMQVLDHFLSSDDPWAELFRDETIFYYLYLQFYIQNKREEVFAFIRQHKLDVRNNYLYAYLYANLCINDQQSALAEKIIMGRSHSPGYLDMPVWDLEMGYASLNHLEPGRSFILKDFSIGSKDGSTSKMPWRS